jgi:hypothetical protein
MCLYGIETEDDCSKAIDELIGMADAAQEALEIASPAARRTVADLNFRLKELFKKNKRRLGPAMSPVERAYFWPAIQKAYVSAPKLSSPKTWPTGVAEIKINLYSQRPPDNKTNRQ